MGVPIWFLVGWLSATPAPTTVAAGRTLFESRCALCHPVTAGGASAQGPNLRGVVDRKAGTVDFGYSRALVAWGQRWTPALLDRYLRRPAELVPGTSMVLDTKDAQERAALVAYLGSLRSSTKTQAAAGARNPVPGSASVDAGVAAPSGPAETRTPVEVLTGAAALGDWRTDAPGVRRHIRVEDLPAPFATPSAGNSPRVVPRPSGALPRVPAGFRVDLYAEGLENPRIVRVAPNGDVFVAETAEGRVRVLRSAPGATQATERWAFADGLAGPFGMAFHPAGAEPQWLYVAETDRVLRFAYRNGDTRARARPEVVVEQLSPTTGGHTTRDIAFSPDGRKLFVSVGSQSNAAERLPAKSRAEIEAWEAEHGLGATWGFEERRASVQVFEVTGGPGRLYATGLRNCVGLAVHPRTGELWCSTNERDGMGDDLVPDYVTRVRPGTYFGWPWYWLGNHEDPRLRGRRPDLAEKVTVPDVLIQSHSASLGMTFYDGAAFPAEYRGDGFAAEHGSWNRARRTGYKVIRIVLHDGVPTGEYEDFLTGFVVDDRAVWGRPVGVAVARDGALLVTEDGGGTLWRVAPLAGR